MLHPCTGTSIGLRHTWRRIRPEASKAAVPAAVRHHRWTAHASAALSSRRPWSTVNAVSLMCSFRAHRAARYVSATLSTPPERATPEAQRELVLQLDDQFAHPRDRGRTDGVRSSHGWVSGDQKARKLFIIDTNGRRSRREKLHDAAGRATSAHTPAELPPG